MSLNQLAKKAKTSEDSLKKLLDETLKYRRLYVRKLAPIQRNKDYEGELFSLTWEVVHRFDIDRGVQFVTFLLCVFNKYVSKEYEKAFKEMEKKKAVRDGFASVIMKKTGIPTKVYINDFLEFMEKHLYGSEKIVWERAIKIGKPTHLLVKEKLLPQRKAYKARSNILMLANTYLYVEDKMVLKIIAVSIKLRGLVEELIERRKKRISAWLR